MSRAEAKVEQKVWAHFGCGRDAAGYGAARARARPAAASLLNERKDGSKFLNWLRVSPLFDDGDRVWPSRYVGILEDHCAIRAVPASC